MSFVLRLEWVITQANTKNISGKRYDANIVGIVVSTYNIALGFLRYIITSFFPGVLR